MTNAIVNEMHMKCGIYAGLTGEQLAAFYEFVKNAIPCNRKDVAADVYSKSVANAAVRAARSIEKLDRTDRCILGLPEPVKQAKTTAAQKNPCTRCGGVGTGNWGQVRNGVCFKCGGDGINRKGC